MLESHSPVLMNLSPSPLTESPPRSFSIGPYYCSKCLSNCQEPSKKRPLLSKAKSSFVSQSTNHMVLFCKSDYNSSSVEKSGLGEGNKVQKSKSKGSITTINLVQAPNASLKSISKPPEKVKQKVCTRNGSVKINPIFQITPNKKKVKGLWTNEKILVNFPQNNNLERIVTTSFPAKRLKKGKKGNKDLKDKPIVFPEIQTPLRDVKKNYEDSRFFNKSFSDLKELPLYRLSIENNMFSKLRKYKGKLK